MDKAKAFLLKIQTKNQLKNSLKKKKAEYAKISQHSEFVDDCLILQKEIRAIELELGKFD